MLRGVTDLIRDAAGEWKDAIRQAWDTLKGEQVSETANETEYTTEPANEPESAEPEAAEPEAAETETCPTCGGSGQVPVEADEPPVDAAGRPTQ